MGLELVGGNSLINARELLARAGLGANMSYADLGCGAVGHFVFAGAEIVGPQGRVYAVDILPAVLTTIDTHKAIAGLHNITTLRANIERVGSTPIPDATVDVVSLLNTMFQVSDKPSALREAVRILRYQGILVIVEWKQAVTAIGPSADMRISVSQMKEWCSELPLTLMNAFDAGLYHYALVYKKTG